MPRKTTRAAKGPRKKLTSTLKNDILIANRHACCVCGKGGVQIHHINGNPSDNRRANLAVLCAVPHHDKATAPAGLTAKLTAAQIRRYKRDWEADCGRRAHNIARGRAAFFMVDYKNVERIGQLYAALNRRERKEAAAALELELRDEDRLRREQHFDVSMEPTTAWSGTVVRYLQCINDGVARPPEFDAALGHPADNSMPAEMPYAAYFDIWCQLQVRTLILARGTLDANDLTMLENPVTPGLTGRLVSFEGRMSGDIAFPDNFRETPISRTTLTVQGSRPWRAILTLKTHYVYSMTAADPLGSGRENGILVFRSVDAVPRRGAVRFSATPLIIGNGVLSVPS